MRRRYAAEAEESRCLVKSGAEERMDTGLGVAFPICREGRVVTLQAKALSEVRRAAS